MKIAIIDDNTHYIDTLATKIANYFNKNKQKCMIYSSVDPTELLNQVVHNIKYDYIFLDYDMPNINGYDLGKQLRKYDSSFKLIYVTAYNDKVYECITNNVFYYIRKSMFEVDITKCFEYITKHLSSSSKILFETTKGEIFIPILDIIYFESINRKLFVQTINENFQLKNISLKNIYEETNNFHFVYICKGIIINFKFVSNIHKNILYMYDGKIFEISRRKVKQVNTDYLTYKYMV